MRIENKITCVQKYRQRILISRGPESQSIRYYNNPTPASLKRLGWCLRRHVSARTFICYPEDHGWAAYRESKTPLLNLDPQTTIEVDLASVTATNQTNLDSKRS